MSTNLSMFLNCHLYIIWVKYNKMCNIIVAINVNVCPNIYSLVVKYIIFNDGN